MGKKAKKNGANDRNRTDDLFITSELLYRLSYIGTGQKNGASERIRTVDNHVGNVMLYQLSYTRLYCSLIYC